MRTRPTRSTPAAPRCAKSSIYNTDPDYRCAIPSAGSRPDSLPGASTTGLARGVAEPKLTKRTIDALPRVARETFVWDEELPRFGLRLFPSRRRTFVVQYRTRGRSRRIALGAYGVLTPAAARRKALVVLAKVADGEDPSADRQACLQVPTVRAVAERYLAQHADLKKKPSAAAGDRRNLRLHVPPAMGPKRISDVTRADVIALHHSLSGTSINANRVLALVSKIMNLAEAWGLRPDGSNPCRHAERYRERRRDRFLSSGDLSRLGHVLAAAERQQTEPAAALAAIRLLLFTGMRRGEVLGLRWEEVNFERTCLRPRDSKTGLKVLPLNAPTLEILARLHATRSTSPWVIEGARRGKPFVGLHRISERLRAAAELGDLRIHDLRHSFASVGASAGMRLPLVGALLGHRSPATTARFAHLHTSPLQEASERIGARLASDLQSGRLAWPDLLRRVFAVDVLECPRYGGHMRLLAAIEPPDVTQAILDCLELPSRAPPTAPAVRDPEEWPGDFEANL